MHPFLGFLRANQYAHKPTEIGKPGVPSPANDSKFFRKLLGILPGLRKFSDYGPLVQSLTKKFKISEEDLLQPRVTHSVCLVWELWLSKCCLMGTFLIMAIVILDCI